MREVWVRAKMTEMMHWNLKRALQIPFWNVKIEVYGTTTVGEESGRLPPRTAIDWTPPPVKENLNEPEFETVDNPGQ